MARKDLEAQARALVPELMKRQGVNPWDGWPHVFPVMLEIQGPIDRIKFDGERWTYHYAIEAKNKKGYRTIESDITPVA
jgi:hypothetical protein